MKYYEYGFYSETGEFFAIGEYGFDGLTLFTTAETAEQAESNFRDYVDSEYDKPEYTVRGIDGISANHIEI